MRKSITARLKSDPRQSIHAHAPREALRPCTTSVYIGQHLLSKPISGRRNSKHQDSTIIIRGESAGRAKARIIKHARSRQEPIKAIHLSTHGSRTCAFFSEVPSQFLSCCEIGAAGLCWRHAMSHHLPLVFGNLFRAIKVVQISLKPCA